MGCNDEELFERFGWSWNMHFRMFLLLEIDQKRFLDVRPNYALFKEQTMKALKQSH